MQGWWAAAIWGWTCALLQLAVGVCIYYGMTGFAVGMTVVTCIFFGLGVAWAVSES